MKWVHQPFGASHSLLLTGTIPNEAAPTSIDEQQAISYTPGVAAILLGLQVKMLV